MPLSSIDAPPLVERRVGPPACREAAALVPSRSAVRALRRFLNARRDGWVVDARLAQAARIAAEEARCCGLPAERMLAALERTWWALDEVRALPAIEARESWSRLVSLSIRAYHAPRRSGGPAPDSTGGDHAQTAA